MAKRTVFIIDPDGKIVHKHGNMLSLSYDGVDDITDALSKNSAAA